jgi:hypothetical protein
VYNNNFSNYGSSFGNQSSQGTTSRGTQGNTAQYQGFQKQYQPVGFVQSFYGQNTAQGNQSYGQSTSPESFHTANYRGNQMGHDAYLRSDSSTPTQQQQSNFQGGYALYNGMNNSQFGMNQSQQPSYQNFQQNQQQNASNQFGMSGQASQPYGQQNVSQNAFHTANYRGNQPGHDAYLRSDSSTPTQQSYQSGLGTQGVQSFNTGFNTMGQNQQFGSNSTF